MRSFSSILGASLLLALLAVASSETIGNDNLQLTHDNGVTLGAETSFRFEIPSVAAQAISACSVRTPSGNDWDVVGNQVRFVLKNLF